MADTAYRCGDLLQSDFVFYDVKDVQARTSDVIFTANFSFPAGLKRIVHGQFDFPLRSDADSFQKLAGVHIESIVVHRPDSRISMISSFDAKFGDLIRIPRAASSEERRNAEQQTVKVH